MLGSNGIKEEIKRGSIYVDEGQNKIKQNSIQVSLGNSVKQYISSPLDVTKPSPTKEIPIPDEGLVLNPNELYLGRTLEFTKTYGFVPILIGTDDLAAVGLEAHITAGFGDNGFEGTWTLEILCTNKTRVYKGMPIGEVIFLPVIGDHKYYRGKYFRQIDTTASRLSNEYEEGVLVKKYVNKK